MKVWIVMEHWTISDNGDDNVEFAAVHMTEAGARADLKPDYEVSAYPPGSRERYTFAAEVLP